MTSKRMRDAKIGLDDMAQSTTLESNKSPTGISLPSSTGIGVVTGFSGTVGMRHGPHVTRVESVLVAWELPMR